MSDERDHDPQPAPAPSRFPALWPMLIARMEERHAFGLKRYKVALQPFNGRDALKDLTDEALDELVYKMQWFYENRPVRDQVREFKALVKHPAPERPDIPSRERMLFSLSLFIEEAMEVVEACYPEKDFDTPSRIKAELLEFVRTHEPEPDMELLIDGLGDTDYVTESFRQELGTDGRPIAALIHDANMKKQGGPVDPVTKKTLKPPGWTPPDIAGELRRQGWKG
jgi:predicted HAD superfamily Cof-like phosphohydrolase